MYNWLNKEQYISSSYFKNYVETRLNAQYTINTKFRSQTIHVKNQNAHLALCTSCYLLYNFLDDFKEFLLALRFHISE